MPDDTSHLSIIDGRPDSFSEKECECFGDSGLHASTHWAGDPERERCDLCGWPVPAGSMDVVKGIPAAPAPDPLSSHQPFSGDRQARAALSAWLLDGADIIKRCRVGDEPLAYESDYCRSIIAEVAMIALRSFDSYRGVQADGLEYKALRQWIEREIEGLP